MKRTLMMVALAAFTMMVALPGATKSERLELVEGSVVADKRGYDADVELDFERLEVVSTAENLELHIQTYTAWAEIPEPQHARLAIKVGKAGWKTFYPNAYTVDINEDGSLTTGTELLDSKSNNCNQKKKDSWTGNSELVQVELDGTSIVVTIPWSDLPHEEIWLQACAHHVVEKDDEEAEEAEEGEEGEEAGEGEEGEAVTKAHDTGAEPEAAEPEAAEPEKKQQKKKKGEEPADPDAVSYNGGSGGGVPSDFIPNYWEAIAATKP